MISWIGGKSKVSSWIIPFIPKDIKTYTEPFSGAMWVYLKMNIKDFNNIDTVVYNDFNDYLTNLFMCCKNHKEFYDFIKDVKSQNEDLFYQFQTELNKHEKYDMPDFDKALKFAYLTSQVFSGISPLDGKFIDLKGKYRSKFDTFKDKLINKEYTEKLDRITNFENLDFENVINKYDSPTTFHYVDAPYYNLGEKYYSNQNFKLEDHERLAKILKSIKGKFAMSYYDFPKLHEWFPETQYHWESKQFFKAAMAKAGKEQTKGVELLIMNY
jgi:DNA adenine methylase